MLFKWPLIVLSLRLRKFLKVMDGPAPLGIGADCAGKTTSSPVRIDVDADLPLAGGGRRCSAKPFIICTFRSSRERAAVTCMLVLVWSSRTQEGSSCDEELEA
jgi:hypothetical protein